MSVGARKRSARRAPAQEAPLHPEPKETRGRPRCVESQARILNATVELMEREPWSQLTVEVIAQRARVGKQTIYKWWGGRPALVMDAYLSNIQARVPIPDTGSARRDLALYLKRSSKVLRETNAGRTLAVIIAEAQHDQRLAHELRERFLASRREALRSLLRRGIERRELRPDLELELVMDLLYGVFWYRILVRTGPLNGRFVDQVVALMMRAIAAPGRRRVH